MSFEPREFLRHILVETEYLEEASRGLSKEEFLGSQTLRRAFSRSLEIVGENKIPKLRRQIQALIGDTASP